MKQSFFVFTVHIRSQRGHGGSVAMPAAGTVQYSKKETFTPSLVLTPASMFKATSHLSRHNVLAARQPSVILFSSAGDGTVSRAQEEMGCANNRELLGGTHIGGVLL